MTNPKIAADAEPIEMPPGISMLSKNPLIAAPPAIDTKGWTDEAAIRKLLAGDKLTASLIGNMDNIDGAIPGIINNASSPAKAAALLDVMVDNQMVSLSPVATKTVRNDSAPAVSKKPIFPTPKP